jgi:lysophospholipase L1-like esterase
MTKSSVRSRPAPPKSLNPRLLIGAATLVATVLAWLLWPNSLSQVKNLESSGTEIIAFGDSLTSGFGAREGEDYPSRLAERIGATVINAGIAGDTTDSALARIDEDVLARDSRIVIVGLGGNDFLRRSELATTERNLRTIVRKIQESGAMVILLGFEFPSLGASYADMYERVADDEGCLLIPDVVDGILNDPSLKSDEIHPNARGYELMAERVEGPLEKLIAKADASR